MRSTLMMLSPSRVSRAVLPSGRKFTELGDDFGLPRSTFPTDSRRFSLTAKTEMVPSVRFATSTSAPSGEIETPAAPSPAVTCWTDLGGVALRSITVTRLSGTILSGFCGSILVAASPLAAPVTSVSVLRASWRGEPQKGRVSKHDTAREPAAYDIPPLPHEGQIVAECSASGDWGVVVFSP
jgi:hypothetical protein